MKETKELEMKCLDNKYKGICIFAISLLLWSTAIYFNMLTYSNNLIILLLYLMIFFEISKLLFEFIAHPDAPIKIRYILAGMAIAVAREFYIALIDHDIVMLFTYLGLIAILLVLRWLAILSTKEGR